MRQYSHSEAQINSSHKKAVHECGMQNQKPIPKSTKRHTNIWNSDMVLNMKCTHLRHDYQSFSSKQAWPDSMQKLWLRIE